MKKIMAIFTLVASVAFVACGPSKLEIQEQSTMCDVMIEVRQVLNDSISLFVGNNFYLNAKQVLPTDMYPLLVSTRDPAEFEKPTRTDVLQNDEELLNYLRRNVPQMVQIGLVIGETAYHEIGFDEAETIEKITKIFKKLDGGTMLLFHEKGGEYTSMKKLY